MLLKFIKNYFTLVILCGALISGLLIAKYTTKPNETKFLITSEGSNATVWLTSVLNTVPKLYCTHYDEAAYKIRDGYVDIKKYTQISKISLDEYFYVQKHNAASYDKVYGNVHGFILNMVLDKQPNPDIKIANLIRHPISHIDSMYNFWVKNPKMLEQLNQFLAEKSSKTLSDYPPSTNHYDPPFKESLILAQQLQQKYGYTMPDDLYSWAFLITIARFDRVHANMQKADALQIPQYRFEDFTNNPKVLADLVHYISDNKLYVSNYKISKMQKIPAQNVNRVKKLKEDEIYASWTTMQKAMFAIHIHNIGGKHNNAYVQHGYDLSFVEELK